MATSDPTLDLFLDGDPRVVAETVSFVRTIVHFKGFYIPEEQRSDVAQEVMLDLWRATTGLEQDRPRNFRAFVRTLAYRRCVDWVRAQRDLEPVEESHPSGSADPESRVLKSDDLRLGARIIGRLRDSCRELFGLVATEEKSYREIAALQSRSEKAVRNQMSDCLGHARKIHRQLRAREATGGRGRKR